MGNKAKVTVVVPVYNVEKYLEQCMDTIVNQTLEDIEIICVNDGSTDDSLKILEQYAKEDGRITLISQENKGLSATRNRGLELVETPYVYFMDSDDILELNALEYLCKEMELNKLDILYFDGVAFYENDEAKKMFPMYYTTYTYSRSEELGEIYTGLEIMKEFQRIKSYRANIGIQIFSANFLKGNNFKFYEGIFHEDQLFTFSTMLSAKYVSHRKRELFHRRVRSGSIMTQEVSLDHVRGYLIAYIEMQQFCDILKIVDCYNETTEKVLNNVKNNLVKCAEKIKFSKDNMLALEEQIILMNILKDEMLVRDNKVLEVKNKNQELKNRNQELKVGNQELKIIKKQKEKELDVVRCELVHNEKKCERYEKEIENILNSFTFKCGSVITFLPRKIRSIIRGQ